MRLRTFFFALLAITLAAPAQAEWHEASSEHFLIYADQSERDVREFAENLEKYHAAMAFITSKGTEKVSPSNRVTIFVVNNERAVQKLLGDTSGNVAGFYKSRAGGSVAFVPKVKKNRSRELSFSEIVLLHEYAHHFMYSNYPLSFPLWYSEGFAEFYASAAFDRDGSVWLGRPAQHRSYELFNMRKVPVELLLDTAAYTASNEDREKQDSFYGRSWLMFHYMTMQNFDPESGRSGQIRVYLRNLLQGMEAIEAARDAFGNLEQLDDDLKDYLNQRRIPSFKLSPEKISIKNIAIRKLSKGAGKVMPLLAQSRRGVDAEIAAEVLADVRAIAASYADDPFVQMALAEAEYDAGNDAEAIAAADSALAVWPQNSDAHNQKIYALFRSAENAAPEDEQAAWKALSQAVSAGNAAENDNPIPLIYYYRSYLAQGKAPPELAKQALQQALGLAPYDKGLRFSVAQQQIDDELYTYARYTLAPLILDPHNSGFAETAKQLLDSIEGKEDRAEAAADQ